MKKHIIISILAVVVLLFTGFLLLKIFSPKVNISGEKAKLSYIYNDKNIIVDLSAEENKQLKEMFNGKKLYKDSPSCGFSKNISICFNESYFCIACDQCSTVKLDNKYFNISKADRKVLNGIFEKYGGSFPCI
ncbi:MAG: hypothetical protein MJ132_06085 [Clostridia bacterium]|nr:hypothetical protein [Clostridia bacterium]